MAAELEKPLAESAAVQGDRGARCAAAEALAGILASPDVITDGVAAEGSGTAAAGSAAGAAGAARASAPWAAPLLLKSVMEAAADSTEEWLRAVRYAIRGENGGDGAPWLLQALAVRPDKTTATVAQQARRLETALMCVAQLAAPPAGVAFQEALMAEMAAEGEATPLAHDSRAVREEAAKVAALLVATHSSPSYDPWLLSTHALEAGPTAYTHNHHVHIHKPASTRRLCVCVYRVLHDQTVTHFLLVANGLKQDE